MRTVTLTNIVLVEDILLSCIRYVLHNARYPTTPSNQRVSSVKIH